MSTTMQALREATSGTAVQSKSILNYLEDPRVVSGIAAVAGRFLTPDRMLRLSVNAIKKTPKLLQCDPQSVLGAIMTSAALGLEPNTVQQQAFLIPYRKRAQVNGEWTDVMECQFQIGYRGFITLAYRSPYVKQIVAEAIHRGDVFEHELGSQAFLRYRKTLEERGDLLGAFSYIRMDNGSESACVLPLTEIHKIRARSETYRSLTGNVAKAENDKARAKAEAQLAETPWVMWEDDMAAKSAIKKHAKQMPIAVGDTLLSAAAIDSDAEIGRANMRAMVDPDIVRSVVGEGAPPPAIEHDPSETLDMPLPKKAEKAAVRSDVPEGDPLKPTAKDVAP